MNTGREIIHSILSGGDIRIVLDAGLNKNWLEGNNTGSEIIFTGEDRKAYSWLISYWNRHHNIPDTEIFRQHFPEETLKFGSKIYSLEELAELADQKVKSFLLAGVIGKVIDLHGEGKINQAIMLMSMEANSISNTIKYRKSKADDITSSKFDLEKLLNTEMQMGIPFGIKEIDDEFYGFQPSQLITLMGRQKSGKSWTTVNSALNAWKEGYTVLVFSVEMDVKVFHQRILCLGSKVSNSRMRRGKLWDSEKDRVRQFHEKFTEEEGRFLISKKKSMITVDDIREEIKQHNPNIVYIDGFSFMVDKKTGKMTSDWQANENVAYELKELAMEEEIVVFVNTQVQEKQYSPKHGIEARTIASGTGLLKASDLVLGQDKDEDRMTINCIYSRYEYTPTVVLEVDWQNMEFVSVQEQLKEVM